MNPWEMTMAEIAACASAWLRELERCHDLEHFGVTTMEAGALVYLLEELGDASAVLRDPVQARIVGLPVLAALLSASRGCEGLPN